MTLCHLNHLRLLTRPNYDDDNNDDDNDDDDDDDDDDELWYAEQNHVHSKTPVRYVDF